MISNQGSSVRIRIREERVRNWNQDEKTEKKERMGVGSVA
jgi:hypothetical protein